MEINKQSISQKRLKRDYINIIIIIISVIATYGQSISFDFVWDDKTLFLPNPYLQEPLSNFWKAFIPGEVLRAVYTPVTNIIYLFLYKLFGETPAPYHVVSLCSYMATLILVYIFFRSIFYRQTPALAASLLFSVHTLHVEPVCWICGNGYILSAFFLFAALITFIKGVKRNVTPHATFLLAILFFILSILSQPMGVVLPGILLIYTIFFCKKKMRENITFVGVLGIITLIYVHLSIMTLNMERVSGAGNFTFSKIIILAAKHFINIFIPIEYMPDRPSSSSFSPQQWWLIPSFILIAGIFIAIYIRSTPRVLRFFLSWFVVTIFPYSQIFFTTPIITADRYMYMPSIASCGILVFLISYLKNFNFKGYKFRKILSSLIFSLIFLYYALTTYIYASVWKTDLTLWNYNYINNPHSKMGLYNLAQAHFLKGNNIETIKYGLEAQKQGNKELNTYILIFAGYYKTGQYEKARELTPFITSMIKTNSSEDGSRGSIIFLIGTNYYYTGNISEFIKYYWQGVQKNESDYPDIFKEGMRAHKKGNYKMAAEKYSSFLSSSMGNMPDIRKLLHTALLQAHCKSTDKSQQNVEQKLKHAHNIFKEFTESIQKGEKNKAKSLAITIFETDPWYPSIALYLAEEAAKQGDLITIKRYLDKETEANPQFKGKERLMEEARQNSRK